MVKFSGHVFHMTCYLLECSKDYGLYIGQKAMYKLEGGADFRNLSFHFLFALCCAQTWNLPNLKIGQAKLGIPSLGANLKIGQAKLGIIHVAQS